MSDRIAAPRRRAKKGVTAEADGAGVEHQQELVEELDIVGAQSIVVLGLGKAELCIHPAEEIGVAADHVAEFPEIVSDAAIGAPNTASRFGNVMWPSAMGRPRSFIAKPDSANASATRIRW